MMALGEETRFPSSRWHLLTETPSCPPPAPFQVLRQKPVVSEQWGSVAGLHGGTSWGPSAEALLATGIRIPHPEILEA